MDDKTLPAAQVAALTIRAVADIRRAADDLDRIHEAITNAQIELDDVDDANTVATAHVGDNAVAAARACRRGLKGAQTLVALVDYETSSEDDAVLDDGNPEATRERMLHDRRRAFVVGVAHGARVSHEAGAAVAIASSIDDEALQRVMHDGADVDFTELVTRIVKAVSEIYRGDLESVLSSDRRTPADKIHLARSYLATKGDEIAAALGKRLTEAFGPEVQGA